jgi:hypothetical protein
MAFALVPAAEFLALGTADFEISAAVDARHAAIPSGLRAPGGGFRPRLPLELRGVVLLFAFICVPHVSEP